MSTESSNVSKSKAGEAPADSAAKSVAAAKAKAAAARAEAAAARAEAAEAEAEAALAAAEEARREHGLSDAIEASGLDAPPVPVWLRRLAALSAIAIGWGFIAWHNHFYFTPPVVILALGWGAGVSTLYFLWRVGAAGADPDVGREDWWRVTGQREELEREKRSLLKTIREIEFDHQTGKLSSVDSQEMIQVARVRAIEVMKALDALSDGAGDARAEIQREVRARLEIEKARKAGKKAKGIVSKDAVSKAAATHKAEAKAAAKAGEAKAAEAKADALAAEAKAVEVSSAPDADAGEAAAEAGAADAAKPDAAKPAGGRSGTAINVSAAADLEDSSPLPAEPGADAPDATPSSAPSERKSPEVSA